MCLAVPGQLIEVNGDQATASLHGNQLDISTALIPDATAGDWVLIHAGFAIQKLEGTELEETWAILQDIADAEKSGQRAAGSRQEEETSGQRAAGSRQEDTTLLGDTTSPCCPPPAARCLPAGGNQ